jgi:hypothetical protein
VTVLHRFLGTWPRRLLALAGSAAIAWVVSQTLPALWHETSERTGLAGSPVRIDLVSNPDLLEKFDPFHNPQFVIARPIESIGAPPNGASEKGRYEWAKAMGGIGAFATVLRLVIRGRSSSPVVLNRLQVEKVDEKEPRRGTLLTYLGQGGGQAVRFFEINLNRDPPSLRYMAEGGGDSTPFPYRVSRQEIEVFDVYAFTLGRHDVLWRMHLSYTADDKQGTLVVDDHGRPFETTAVAFRSQHPFAWFKGKWRDMNRPCC